MRVQAHGLRADLPERWEGRLYLRPSDEREDVPHPVLHLANFGLPAERGDFGTGAVELMREPHVFMSLFEYEPAEAGRPLFAARGLPRPRAHEFAPNALQRRIRGQAGWQRFFTEGGRAFCLYVVLGAQEQARRRVPEINAALDGVRIEAR